VQCGIFGEDNRVPTHAGARALSRKRKRKRRSGCTGSIGKVRLDVNHLNPDLFCALHRQYGNYVNLFTIADPATTFAAKSFLAHSEAGLWWPMPARAGFMARAATPLFQAAP
jgi:hypothetical protein